MGEMTNFKYFNNDIEFLKLMWQIFDIVDKDGTFGIFTSFLKHYCNRNRNKDIKYALSFNCNYGN